MPPEPKSFGRVGDFLIWEAVWLLIVSLGWVVALLAPRDQRQDHGR